MATTVSVPSTEGTYFTGEKTLRISRSADELCDDLLEHMLDCDLCLNPGKDSCCFCQQLQGSIAAEGGASNGVIFAL
jgi:hypothetical protein